MQAALSYKHRYVTDDGMLDERLMALAAVAVLLVLLRVHRRMRAKPMDNATAMVRLTDELWKLATAVPPAHLTTPLRQTVSRVLTAYAEQIAQGPLHLHAPTLHERSQRVLNLAKRNPLQVRSLPVAQSLRRIAELLEQAHADEHIDDKTFATAQMAANLSADMAEIDALCNKARHSAKLRIFDEARTYKDQAKSTCERLPKEAATRVRRVIEQRVPV